MVYLSMGIHNHCSLDPTVIGENCLEPVESRRDCLTNGCFKSWAAVGRSSGLNLKHFLMKSRASSDNELGITGSSPRPIL